MAVAFAGPSHAPFSRCNPEYFPDHLVVISVETEKQSGWWETALNRAMRQQEGSVFQKIYYYMRLTALIGVMILT